MSLTDGNNQNQNDYVEKRLKTILENDSMDELVIDSVIIMFKISQWDQIHLLHDYLEQVYKDGVFEGIIDNTYLKNTIHYVHKLYHILFPHNPVHFVSIIDITFNTILYDYKRDDQERQNILQVKQLFIDSYNEFIADYRSLIHTPIAMSGRHIQFA